MASINSYIQMQLSLSALLLASLLVFSCSQEAFGTVGFRIGEISGYKLLNHSSASSLYEVQCAQLNDSRPVKLLELVGSHYEVGYDYGAMLGQQIVRIYRIFMRAGFKKAWQRLALEQFLDWQYDEFVSKEIPVEFKEELRGMQDGASKEQNVHKIRNLVQRVLVISSYPGDFTDDVAYAMLDVFLRKYLRIHNEILLNKVEENLLHFAKLISKFFNRKRIHCSFFAAWGTRTVGGKLFTMRNLDWEANSGINQYKLITIWKVTGTIPHVTIGFPGITGALTGMSAAGLTVHEAGLDSMKVTEMGFQWTLRLRFILMHANNLAEAKQIWEQTTNTFGMNHMIASASDLMTGQPALVMETMRNYTAWFLDNDSREKNVNFTDPETNKSYRAGWAMKDAVFRTNHGYDPTIRKFVTSQPTEGGSTMHRYRILRDSFQFYPLGTIGELEALNITGNVGHKGGNDFYKCPAVDNGTNVISVMFIPAEMRMFAAIEFGSGPNYKTACCGVYMNMNLTKWFSKK